MRNNLHVLSVFESLPCSVVLLSLLLMSVAACSGSTPSLKDEVEVPTSPYVTLDTETRARVDEAVIVTKDTDAEPLARAEAYLYISDINLLMWDEVHRKIEVLDETQGKEFKQLQQAGRVYFMQAHRARARSWAERAAVDSKYVKRGAFEARFKEAWDQYQSTGTAFDSLSALLSETITAKKNQYIDVDFLSDLRYSTAIFYTLQERPAGDMAGILTICQGDEAEAVRFAGDIAYLYDKLAAKPETAADTYRAIAKSNPQTREGYEAQVAVLDALRKKQRAGAMETGSSDTFDTSSEGLKLFETVNQDLGVLVEMNAHKEAWKDKTVEGSATTDARAEELVRSFTVRMHGLAQQQKNTTLYELASSAYEKYHLLFPNSGYAYEMLYLHAEVLYTLERFDGAYARYKEALGTAPQGKYRKEILKALVMSAHKRCTSSPLPSTASDSKIEMPEVHRDFIGSGEQFISSLGDSDPDMAGYVRYEIILRHVLFGEIRVAEPLLEEMVKFDSSHPQAPKAAITWLEVLAREAIKGDDRDARALERAIDRIRSTSSLMSDQGVRDKLDQVSGAKPVVSGIIPR